MKTLLFISILVWSSCLHNKQRLSQLQSPLAKPMSSFQPPNQELPEIYVRQPVLVVPVDESRQYDGSLFDANDHRNNLFSSQFLPVRGRFLEVQTKLRGRLAQNDSPKPEASAPKEDQGMDKDLEDALAALPDLTNEQKEDLRLLKSLIFEIVDVNPAGDVRLKYQRRSDNSEDYHLVDIEGVIPSENLMGSESLTTEDIRNVKFVQLANHSRIERTSVDWQDEYLIRLSGFTEVKSLSAKNMEDKRNQLVKTRAEVEQKIKQVGQDRQKFAAERQKYLDDQNTDRKRIADLERDLKEKEEKIKDLTPKENAEP